jgi:[ribosomal protein S18]-alanine N-acetyltransferase
VSAITEAGSAHAALLAAMHGMVFPHDPWNEAAFLSLLGQQGVLGLVHEAGGVLLLRAVLDEAEILTIGVLERRQGLGGALLREGIRRLRGAGVRKLYLEVAMSNAPARALYENLGFMAAGLRKAYYEDGGDALNMRLDLDVPGS